MKEFHDNTDRDAFKARLAKLTPATPRKWGKMSPDQMLWHCAEAMDVALGNKPYGAMPPKPPLPGSWVAWLLLNVPWPKGKLPTAPMFVAKGSFDFEAERRRILALIDAIAARDPASDAQLHPIFGRNTIDYQSRLQAKHLNHHLEQFGV